MMLKIENCNTDIELINIIGELLYYFIRFIIKSFKYDLTKILCNFNKKSIFRI